MDLHDETTDMLLDLDNIYYGLMEPMYYAVIVGGCMSQFHGAIHAVMETQHD